MHARILAPLLCLWACSDGGGTDDGTGPAGTDTPTDTSPVDSVVTGHTGTPTPQPTTTTLVEAELQAEGVVTCADPSQRSTETWVKGVIGDGPDWVHVPGHGNRNRALGPGARGVVVGDFDGDAILDLVVPQTHERSRLLLGVGDGSFTEVGPIPGVDGDGVQGPAGGAAADIDGDGDLDVFLYGQLGTPPVMLVNDGSANFTVESHPEWDDPEVPGCGGSASFADFDLDGDVDLFYGRLAGVTQDEEKRKQYFFTCPSRLLSNDGDGTFTDVTEAQLGDELAEVRVMASGWHQFDDDPWPELYIVVDAIIEGNNDPNIPTVVGSNMLFDNDGGQMSRRVADGMELVQAGMGFGAADFNHDGITDVVISDIAAMQLLLSEPALDLWIDHANAWELRPSADDNQGSAWGGEFSDLDNDGLLDVVMTYGAFTTASNRQPDDIYLNQGDHFVRAGVDWGFDDTYAMRGFIVADLNRDGWPDVVKRELGGLVLTHTSNCGTEAWLELALQQPELNRDAIGGTVHVEAGGQTFVRSVSAGSTSFSSGGPPVVHVGLGQIEQIDRIRVVWPDASESVVNGPIDSRQRLRIVRK
jgi:hypothetical protein